LRLYVPPLRYFSNVYSQFSIYFFNILFTKYICTINIFWSLNVTYVAYIYIWIERTVIISFTRVFIYSDFTNISNSTHFPWYCSRQFNGSDCSNSKNVIKKIHLLPSIFTLEILQVLYILHSSEADWKRHSSSSVPLQFIDYPEEVDILARIYWY
jgi:hypothetical protein